MPLCFISVLEVKRHSNTFTFLFIVFEKELRKWLVLQERFDRFRRMGVISSVSERQGGVSWQTTYIFTQTCWCKKKTLRLDGLKIHSLRLSRTCFFAPFAPLSAPSQSTKQTALTIYQRKQVDHVWQVEAICALSVPSDPCSRCTIKSHSQPNQRKRKMYLTVIHLCSVFFFELHPEDLI